MDEDTIDIELRTPREVGERCIVLATLLRRIWIESLSLASPDVEPNPEAFDLREWLRVEGLWSRLTATEEHWLTVPAGQLADEDTATIVSQAESLVALGWALKLTDDLPVVNASDVSGEAETIPAPWDSTKEWLGQRELQPFPAIARERDRAELYAWRAGIEPARRESFGSDRAEIETAISDVAHEAVAAGLVERNAADDFNLGPTTVPSIDAEELENLITLTTERLRAFNWLCGFGISWDDVPLDI